jgi:hypothetical protein
MISFRRRGREAAWNRRGLLRVAAYLSCGTLACSAVSIRHARAEYQDQTLRFGRQMSELAKTSHHEITKLVLNGQPLHIGSSVTSDPPELVLGRYDEYCRANSGEADDFNDIEKQAPDASAAKVREDAKAGAAASALAKAGHARINGKENDGAVICFVKGPRTKSTSMEAFESFMTTGELGAFGELRYAYASKGSDGKTLLLTVWTDSSFNLGDMVADAGRDCPGEDFPEIPRVPNSIRVMSAKAEGTPYAVNVYKTTDGAAKTLEHFDRKMKESGWFTYDPEMTEDEHKGLGRAYMKNAVVVTLGTSKQAEGNFVAVGLAGVAPADRLRR